MSNGNGNGLYQRNPPGGFYGPGGMVQPSTALSGPNFKVTLAPGPSLANGVTTSIPFGTGLRINDTVGTSVLQFDSAGNNLNNVGTSTLTLAVTATVFVPGSSAEQVAWTLILNQNTSGAVFAQSVEIAPEGTVSTSLTLSAVCVLPVGLGVRFQILQTSGGALVPSSIQYYVAVIGSA